MKLDCEILKIDKDTFKDNCIIVKLGSESRPATTEDMEDFRNGLKGLFKMADMDSEKIPILITHHAVSFESISRDQVCDLVNSFLRKPE